MSKPITPDAEWVNQKTNEIAELDTKIRATKALIDESRALLFTLMTEGNRTSYVHPVTGNRVSLYDKRHKFTFKAPLTVYREKLIPLRFLTRLISFKRTNVDNAVKNKFISAEGAEKLVQSYSNRSSWLRFSLANPKKSLD
ncbi:MAG: hypothetical protein EBU08_19490 [Micrococcales bacterium]|nr:hypothetical protein [Micrococcales bacterium]